MAEEGRTEDESPPERVGDWLVGEVLGHGGAGTVYAATHAESRDRGAVKLAHTGAGAVGHHWFTREARLAARLRHPNIVSLIEWGFDDERPFLVYERVEGPRVEEVAGAMSLPAIVRLGRDLLSALGYAHDAGVVHCDVTPSNILIGEDGRALLCDFGLAKARDESRARQLSGQRLISGTPGYLSPEQARGVGSPGPASDLFGCGAVLYRVLTGDAPYGGKSAVEVVQRTLAAPPRPLLPRASLGAPEALIDVVRKLLARDPADRYPNAQRALVAWAAAAGDQVATTESKPASPRRAVGLQSMETILAEPHEPATELEVIDKEKTEAGAVSGVASGGGSASANSAAGAASFLPLKALDRPELARRVLEGLGASLGRVVSLVGPASANLDDVIPEVWEQLHDRGVRVLLARGRRSGRCAPFESLASIVLDAIGAADLSDVRRGVELLVDRARRAGVGDEQWGRDALVGGLLGVGPTGAMRTAVMDAFVVSEALFEPDRRPVVIVIADADRVDEGTLEVVKALTERPSGGVGALLVRNETPPSDSEVVVEATAPDSAMLDAAWQRWSGGTGVPRPPLDGVCDLQVMAALNRGGVDDFDSLTSSLGAGTLSFLRAAAVFGGDVPRRGATDIAMGMTTEAPDDEALSWLFHVGLLWEVGGSCARRERWIRVRSDAFCRHLRDGLERDLERRYQTAAAQWLSRYCLDDSSANWARVAELARAADLPGSAAHALTEAARLELESGRLADAAPHLEAAVALATGNAIDAIDQARAHAWLAEAVLADGRPAEADVHVGAALDAIEPDRDVLRARLLHCRADAAVQADQLERAIGCAEEGLAVLGPDGDPVELARLHALLGWVLGYRLGRNDEGITHGRRALEVASRIDAAAFRASLCGRLGANYLRAGDWDGQLETNQEDLALSTGARDTSGMIRANINIGVCLHNRGRLDRAREHTETALTLATRTGAAGAKQIADNNLAMIALDQGRHEDAEGHLRAVIEGAERTGYRRALGETRITMARLHTRRGEYVAAEVLLTEAADTPDVADREMALRARTLLELARGDTDAASRSMEDLLEIDPHDPYERALSALAHAAVLRATGRPDDATAIEEAADATFESLGADPSLERKRWGTG